MTEERSFEERLKAIEEAADERIRLLEARLRGEAQAAAEAAIKAREARRAATPATFTREQLRDSKFYQEHVDEILGAVRDGRITGVHGIESGPAIRKALWEQIKEGQL